MTADRILSYWDERLVADPRAAVTTAELLDDFNVWLDGNGHQRWTRETFGPRFGDHTETKAACVVQRRERNPVGLLRRTAYGIAGGATTGQKTVWRGLRWRTDGDPDPPSDQA